MTVNQLTSNQQWIKTRAAPTMSERLACFCHPECSEESVQGEKTSKTPSSRLVRISPLRCGMANYWLIAHNQFIANGLP
jgi:hypothetical protein